MEFFDMLLQGLQNDPEFFSRMQGSQSPTGQAPNGGQLPTPAPEQASLPPPPQPSQPLQMPSTMEGPGGGPNQSSMLNPDMIKAMMAAMAFQPQRPQFPGAVAPPAARGAAPSIRPPLGGMMPGQQTMPGARRPF